MPDLVVIVFIAMLGLAVGSFLNVCIYRLPGGASVVSPSSRCSTCGACLKLHDLIPILSYLLLRGRCRYCGVAFSGRYALVELITAILFVWCYVVAGPGAELIKALLLTAFLIVITFIDYDHQLIFDKTLLWLAGTGMVLNMAFSNNFLAGYLGGGVPLIGHVGVLNMVAASLGGGGIMLLIALISRGGMGGGDVKFVAALGIWLGFKLVLLVLLLSFLLGGVIGLVAIILRLKGRKDFIPFGPFIAIAAFIGFLYGSTIISWYFSQLRM